MINHETAVEVARKRAQKNNWGFSEPVEVVHRRGWFGKPGRFEIETNASRLGTKARFVVKEDTGEIIAEGYVPR